MRSKKYPDSHPPEVHLSLSALQNPVLHLSTQHAGGVYDFSQIFGSASHFKQISGAVIVAVQAEHDVLLSRKPTKAGQERH